MMENRLKLVLLAVVLAAACHRGSSTMTREQKNYQVVPEGQAGGVSATINAPGETAPPLTNTSADTTSNFTLAPNVDASATMPGTIAGTLPSTGPVTPFPQAAPPPPRVIVTNTNPPQAQPQPPPRRKQPELPPPPPQQTDTSTTTAEPAPPPTETADQPDQQEPQQEQPPPPPPPTQTDTRGW
jgi:hypothetical protein